MGAQFTKVMSVPTYLAMRREMAPKLVLKLRAWKRGGYQPGRTREIFKNIAGQAEGHYVQNSKGEKVLPGTDWDHIGRGEKFYDRPGGAFDCMLAKLETQMDPRGETYLCSGWTWLAFIDEAELSMERHNQHHKNPPTPYKGDGWSFAFTRVQNQWVELTPARIELIGQRIAAASAGEDVEQVEKTLARFKRAFKPGSKGIKPQPVKVHFPHEARPRTIGTVHGAAEAITPWRDKRHPDDHKDPDKRGQVIPYAQGNMSRDARDSYLGEVFEVKSYTHEGVLKWWLETRANPYYHSNLASSLRRQFGAMPGSAKIRDSKARCRMTIQDMVQHVLVQGARSPLSGIPLDDTGLPEFRLFRGGPDRSDDNIDDYINRNTCVDCVCFQSSLPSAWGGWTEVMVLILWFKFGLLLHVPTWTGGALGGRLPHRATKRDPHARRNLLYMFETGTGIFAGLSAPLYPSPELPDAGAVLAFALRRAQVALEGVADARRRGITVELSLDARDVPPGYDVVEMEVLEVVEDAAAPVEMEVMEEDDATAEARRAARRVERRAWEGAAADVRAADRRLDAVAAELSAKRLQLRELQAEVERLSPAVDSRRHEAQRARRRFDAMPAVPDSTESEGSSADERADVERSRNKPPMSPSQRASRAAELASLERRGSLQFAPP